MKHGFDSVWVRRGLEALPKVTLYLSRHTEVICNLFDVVSEIRVSGANMAEKIANGKRVLVIDRRSGSLLDMFVNHDEGSLCPNFPKLVPSTNCPYGCQYCFLSGTYPQQAREELYIHAITCIRNHDKQVPVTFCKETAEMHKAFSGIIDATKCNCLP